MCVVNHYRRKEEESKRMYLFGGKRREVSNRMFLLGAAHNAWCSMASAALVGATLVGAAAVGSVVICDESRVVCCMVQ